jgi:hypothetical protein
MKIFIILFLNILSFGKAFSQETDTVYYSADKIYSILTNKLPDELGVGCGRVGAETENVEYFLMLLKSEKYDYIKKLAYSKYASNQFMAVLAIELLEKENKIFIDKDLNKRIKKIKKSGRRFNSCVGCSPSKSKKLRYLLSEEGKKYYLVETLRRYIKAEISKN